MLIGSFIISNLYLKFFKKNLIKKMGGELSNIEGEKTSKTHRKSIEKNNNDSARSTKENTPDQNVGHHKRKKEKVSVVAKDKKSTNHEKKNLELIQIKKIMI